MNAAKRFVMLVVLVVAVVAVWYANNEKYDRFRIDTPAVPALPALPAVPAVTDPEPNPENWDLSQFKVFFVEYRLQRDRVRANEVEMLNQMIQNPNISPEGKKKAEDQLLALIELMEKELMVENMLKAQGYKDAVFFLKDGIVNVVIAAETITETEFLQIADMVSSVTGVSIDKISVVEHNER